MAVPVERLNISRNWDTVWSCSALSCSLETSIKCVQFVCQRSVCIHYSGEWCFILHYCSQLLSQASRATLFELWLLFPPGALLCIFHHSAHIVGCGLELVHVPGGEPQVSGARSQFVVDGFIHNVLVLSNYGFWLAKSFDDGFVHGFIHQFPN